MRRQFRLWIALSCACLFVELGFEPACAAQALPSADEVLRRVVLRSKAPQALQTQGYFLCTKQTLTEEFDPEGRVTKRKLKVRENHSDPTGTSDADKWTSQNGINLGEELLRRFRFTVVGRTVIEGRSTLHLTFVPKDPPAPVHHFQDRLLNRAVGAIWVDEADDELVKASIRLAEPVSFSILGAVESLAFSFERSRAADGTWLTRYTDTQFKGRKFLKYIQTRKRVECTDFRLLQGQREP